MVGIAARCERNVPRFPRLVVPGYPHHITQRGVRRQRTFFDGADYRRYLNLANDLTKEWPVEFWAYCLMPNHVHAIVVPNTADSLSKFFGILHRKYARRTNLRHEWQGHLWQKRFYSVVLDEAHCISALRYVENNPVRSGLSATPEDWPWSSARANLQVSCDSLIDRSRTAELVSDWRTFMGEQDEDEVIKRIREWTGTGRPGGNEHFLRRVESRTGRRVRKRRPGRKRRK